MSDRLKNIIRKGVNTLLEDVWGSPDPKQVVKDKGAYHMANAMDKLDDIDQAFREMGISVNPNELATIDILKSKQPFKMSFKMDKSTSFFGGNKEVSGSAKIDDRHEGLRLFFVSDKGDKVRIDFDRKTLQGKQPQSGGDVSVLMENTKYVVELSNSKSGLKKGEVSIELNGKTKVMSGKDPFLKRLRKMSYITTKKGEDYLVAPSPDKQGGVKNGYKNVTIVQLDDNDPLPNKSFTVPLQRKNKDGKMVDVLEKIKPSEYAYFPDNGGKPERIEFGSRESNQPQTTEIIITSLPNVRLDSNSDEDVDNNAKFKLDKTVKVRGKLDVSGRLSFESGVTLDDINDKLNRGVEAELSSSEQDDKVIKLIIGGRHVVMLKPKSKTPDPYFVTNWKNLPVVIGENANGSDEWSKTNGTATLKLVK
jgi:hypothetical protein